MATLQLNLTQDSKSLFWSNLTQSLTETNYSTYYQLALQTNNQVLQEQIVYLTCSRLAKLSDFCLDQFITANLTHLKQNPSQWCHISQYLASRLNQANCMDYYRLAVESEDEKLQLRIVFYVADLDLRSQLAIYTSEGCGKDKSELIRTLFARVNRFQCGTRRQSWIVGSWHWIADSLRSHHLKFKELKFSSL